MEMVSETGQIRYSIYIDIIFSIVIPTPILERNATVESLKMITETSKGWTTYACVFYALSDR